MNNAIRETVTETMIEEPKQVIRWDNTVHSFVTGTYFGCYVLTISERLDISSFAFEPESTSISQGEISEGSFYSCLNMPEYIFENYEKPLMACL